MKELFTKQLKRYLSGYEYFRPFHNGLMQHLEEILKSGDEELIRMVGDIDTTLIKLSLGEINEATARRCLEDSIGCR